MAGLRSIAWFQFISRSLRRKLLPASAQYRAQMRDQLLNYSKLYSQQCGHRSQRCHLLVENAGFNFSSSKLYPISLFSLVFLANEMSERDKRKLKHKLLQATANNDEYGLKYLLNEIQHLKPELVHEMVNCKHDYGWSPLMCAAINGNAEILSALLKAGADPNIPEGFTTSRSVAHRLRIHELEVRQQRENSFSNWLNPYTNFQGFTALHYAAISDSAPAVKVLLDNGADSLLRNHVGHRASEYVSGDNDALYNLICAHERTQEEKKKEEEIQERLRFPLEKRLRENIIGQGGPISTVSSCIRRKQNGWYDEEHPLVFLFLGSSGVGKTELAKQVANYLHKGDKNGFIRIDMSEYQEKHEVAKLIGSPPGYVGHDDGGQLTKKLRANPNAVVLFDEVEKAHPDVLTVLLQLFDEGRLTDGQGKTIQCKNAIFVMTSNLASDEIAQYGARLRSEAATSWKSRIGKEDANGKGMIPIPETVHSVSRTFKENIVRPILKRHFGRDEFLGRINEFVYFLPFSDDELLQLVEKELEMWKVLAEKRHKIHVSWQKPSVLTILADGYNIYYGARSVKYEVDRRVVSLLASAHERGLLKAGTNVFVKTPATREQLAQSSNLSNAPIEIEITCEHHKPVIVSEKDVWEWHHKESQLSK